MSAGRWAGGLLVLVLALPGCSGLSPVIKPAPWDGYGNSGPLPVRGAGRDAAGPTIVRALRREPKLKPVFERYGEPDTLEVQGSRYRTKEIVLVYRRTGDRILVERSPDGWVARAPETLPGRTRRAAARTPVLGGEAATAPVPTMAQTLECPIDPSRADCLALCKDGAKHEWCR